MTGVLGTEVEGVLVLLWLRLERVGETTGEASDFLRAIVDGTGGGSISSTFSSKCTLWVRVFHLRRDDLQSLFEEKHYLFDVCTVIDRSGIIECVVESGCSRGVNTRASPQRRMAGDLSTPPGLRADPGTGTGQVVEADSPGS